MTDMPIRMHRFTVVTDDAEHYRLVDAVMDATASLVHGTPGATVIIGVDNMGHDYEVDCPFNKYGNVDDKVVVVRDITFGMPVSYLVKYEQDDRGDTHYVVSRLDPFEMDEIDLA